MFIEKNLFLDFEPISSINPWFFKTEFDLYTVPSQLMSESYFPSSLSLPSQDHPSASSSISRAGWAPKRELIDSKIDFNYPKNSSENHGIVIRTWLVSSVVMKTTTSDAARKRSLCVDDLTKIFPELVGEILTM